MLGGGGAGSTKIALVDSVGCEGLEVDAAEEEDWGDEEAVVRSGELAVVQGSGGGTASLEGAGGKIASLEGGATTSLEDGGGRIASLEGGDRASLEGGDATSLEGGGRIASLEGGGSSASLEGFLRSCCRRGPERRGSVNCVVLLWWSTK